MEYHKLFIVSALLIYTFTRIINIEDFPIYFFCDEAIQAVKAETLINNGFRDEQGNFFPLFFHRFINLYNLGITPYFHIPSIIIFGKQVWATRGTVVIISLFGCIFTALILKNIFKIKRYWLGVLFLAATPLHFLFTRSAFEGGITLTLYAAFLYFYFLYRTRKAYYIFPCVLFAALTFYSYSGIYIPLIVTCLFILLSDLIFHLKNPKTNLIAIILAIILFFPAINLQRNNPNLIGNQLSIYGSYLTKNIPIKEKIATFFNNYLTVYSPKFLFSYHPSYHVRHYIKDYGYFPTWSAPFILLGVLYLLLNIKRSPERALFLSLISASLGGALIEPGSHRILIITILLACLFGLGFQYLEYLEEKFVKNKLFVNLISLLLFSFLSFQAIYLTYYSLTTGPLWFQDYGLYGMQYGAKQLFREVNKSLDEYQKAVVSPDFANAPDIFISYFLSKEKQKRTRLASIREFVLQVSPTENTVMFAIPSEYEILNKSGLFEEVRVKKIIYAPNYQPAFYKLELRYKPAVLNGEIVPKS